MEHLDQVRTFWTRNLNGMKFLQTLPEDAQDFWAASALRYEYHYHLPPLFDHLSEASPNGRLLEIGCGMGDDTAQLVRRGFDVTAIDLTEPAVECTRRRLAVCGLSADVRIGNAESLDFEDECFDVVYSFGVLHHSPDTARSIREVHRVLKPDGLASVMLYNRRSLNFAVHSLLRYPFDGSRTDPCPVEHTYRRPDVRTMFRPFRTCSIRTDYLFGTGYGALNKLLPRPVHRGLGRVVGWHLMIEARK